MSRPKIHETDAARVAAYRAKKSRIDLVLENQTAQTIEKLSEQFGLSKNEVCKSLIRFALTNRNWQTQGMIWGR